MTEIAEFKRGAGGRPTRAEAQRRLGNMLETAMRLFLERGYVAVTVEEIAKQACVAKRFIYARYVDKSELFGAAIEHTFMGKFEGLLRGFEPSWRGAESDLCELGRKLLEIAIQPEPIALHRLFISSAPLFPDLARRFVERNRERALREVERVFKFYADRGEIEFPQPQLVIEQFFISVVGIPQRLALLGLRESPEEQEQRLRIAVRLFVRGCAPGEPEA
jgi:TetR/AcrR family transcriptional regulator, mexJK operon transcriptional repressor